MKRKQKHEIHVHGNIEEDGLKRRIPPALSRREPFKELKPRILIICPGENTEPSYFRQFRLQTASIKILDRVGNPMSLVQFAIQEQQQSRYDQIWCVFDKDNFPPIDFNSAIRLAESNSLAVAYSNQAFEYWFILHFQDHQGAAMSRSQYDGIINRCLRQYKLHYDGKRKKIVDRDFFELMLSTDPAHNQERVQLAITRAERNYELLDHSSPAREESSTTVFRLVREILKHV